MKSKLKSSTKKLIVEHLDSLVRGRAAPGFQLSLGFKTETLGCFSAGLSNPLKKRPVKDTTWFDLSSLTKILVTVDLLMRSVQARKISDLQQPLKNYFPFFTSDLKNRTLAELLEHRSGLPPIFEDTPEMPNRDEKIRFFLQKVDEGYPTQPASESFPVVYSDINFMLLGLVLESLYGKPLAQIFQNLEGLQFGPLKHRQVATILSLDSKPKWLQGEAQDPRAAWLEGSAGHAGLFGTAFGVENWGRELFLAYHGKSLEMSDKIVRMFINLENHSGPYVHGFDTPAKGSKVSQSGRWFAANTTIGHLGYTGCSFWMDIEKGIRVSLLSHRFAPEIDPQKLSQLRPGFHDFIMKEVFMRL